MDSLTITIQILVACIILSFLAGAMTRNYSHVDRLWSILPAVFVLLWMRDFSHNIRYVIPAILVCLWAVRLTTNFALKGGYKFNFKRGFYEEDYRWAFLRKKIPNRVLFELFNLTFISTFQLVLIFFFTLPLYFLGSQEGPLSILEYTLFGVHGSLLIIETIADAQQLRFYKMRANPAQTANSAVSLGFNTSGLWRYSRHPNYVCELGQWVVVYAYLHVALGTFHWSGIGSLVLFFLFMGSTRMAEQISASKYPAYKEWQKATPPWIPFLDAPLRKKARREFFTRFFHI